jgi:hypothetical protein
MQRFINRTDFCALKMLEKDLEEIVNFRIGTEVVYLKSLGENLKIYLENYSNLIPTELEKKFIQHAAQVLIEIGDGKPHEQISRFSQIRRFSKKEAEMLNAFIQGIDTLTDCT